MFAAGALSAHADNIAEDMAFTDADATIIVLMASIILLLLGILLNMRRMRIRLERQTLSLKKSERHIRLLGDNLPNVTIFQLTYSKSEGFRFTSMSKGYERALGFRCNQVMADARLAYDHVYEEDIPLLRKAFDKSIKMLEPANLELRVLDVSGQLKWIQVSAVPHRTENRLVWDGFLQDVSVCKQVEGALVEENRNFQNLFQTIDDFLIVCDMDGRLIHTNSSVAARLGYKTEELTEMSIFELYPEEVREGIYQVVAFMQTEQSTTCGLPLRLNGGGTIPVEMNIFQGTWKNEKAIFGVARDIARRQQTESALRESQKMLRLIMDTIPMSVFWKDKDSVYLGCNKTFIHECGFDSLDGIVGKTPYDLFDPAIANAVVERDQRVISSNQPLFNVILSHARPDGGIGWREINKIPLRDENGHAVGVLGVWRDVTEQNRAEERLKRTLEDMERFNQLMRGRERRTLELKAEINSLLNQLGRPRKYRTTTEDLP